MINNSFIDLSEFFGSTATALKVQGQRVRNLIGNRHWLSDGTYKERLIKQALREIIPSTLKVGDGFLVYRKDKNQEGFDVSRQVDILVYDDRFVAPLFKDGDFIVILAETAIAAIEVKSNWGNSYTKIKDDIDKLQSAHQIYRLAKKDHDPNLFTACIAYSSKKSSNSNDRWYYQEKIVQHLREKFVKGLRKYRDIGSSLGFQELKIIKHRVVTQLCPQMIISLDEDCVLVTGVANSVNVNKWNFLCPIVRSVSTSKEKDNEESINLSLHLFFGTLRNRCIEWLNQEKNLKEFELIRSHLNSFIFDQNFSSSDVSFALIPEIDGIKEIFPNVIFNKNKA